MAYDCDAGQPVVIRTALVCLICVLILLTPARGQDTSPERFVGIWVGTQTWSVENPPANAKTPQPVELKIELVDGKLIGVMTPFFGGSDGASFVGGQIVGEDLKAAGVMGQPPAPAAAGARPTRPPTGWKATVKVNFDFKVTGDRNQLVGTADVLMGDVKWTTFKYELSKKRSRY